MTRRTPTTGAKRADDALTYVLTSSPSPTRDRAAGAPTVHGVLRSSFQSEHEARQVFIEMRRRRANDWAELVVLSPDGGVKRIAWFGARPKQAADAPPIQSLKREPQMQATQTLPNSGHADPTPVKRRSTRLRLMAGGAIAAVAIGGAVGAHAVMQPSSRPTPVVRQAPTTEVTASTQPPPDLTADQVEFNGLGGDR